MARSQNGPNYASSTVQHPGRIHFENRGEFVLRFLSDSALSLTLTLSHSAIRLPPACMYISQGLSLCTKGEKSPVRSSQEHVMPVESFNPSSCPLAGSKLSITKIALPDSCESSLLAYPSGYYQLIEPRIIELFRAERI